MPNPKKSQNKTNSSPGGQKRRGRHRKKNGEEEKNRPRIIPYQPCPEAMPASLPPGLSPRDLYRANKVKKRPNILLRRSEKLFEEYDRRFKYPSGHDTLYHLLRGAEESNSRLQIDELVASHCIADEQRCNAWDKVMVDCQVNMSDVHEFRTDVDYGKLYSSATLNDCVTQVSIFWNTLKRD